MPQSQESSDAVARVAANIGVMSAGRLLANVFTFVFYVALSREYGATALGHYAIAMAVTGFAVVFSDFGLTPLTIKEIGRNPRSIQEYAPRIIGLRISMCTVTFAAIFFGSILMIDDAQLCSAMVIIGLFQIVWHFGMGIGGFFTAMGESHLNSMLEIGQRLLMAAAGLAAIAVHADFVVTILAMPVASLLHALVATKLTWVRYEIRRLSLDLDFSKSILRRSFSYAKAGLLSRLQARADLLAVGLFAGSAAAGLYNAAHRIIFLISEIVIYGGMALLPAAAHLAREDMSGFRRLFSDSIGWSLIIGLPMSVGMALTANDMIALLYGKEFAESSYLMLLLSPLALTILLQQAFTSALQALDKEKYWARVWLIATALTIMATLLLVPLFGAAGAAIAMVLTHTALVGLCAAPIRDYLITADFWPTLTSALISGAAMAAVLLLVPEWSIWSKIAAGGATYLAGLSVQAYSRDHYVKPILGRLWSRQNVSMTDPFR